ncbi:MAG: PhoPQ-activated pathogenicity [Bryobacteraceae bacterium]|nr:PhoPQ-activated pathogenicity [Bryobacteraceae bacterium]
MRFLHLAVFLTAVSLSAEETALDRYVKQPDPAYKWSVAAKIPGRGVTAYVLEVTSQNWLTPAEVDRTYWKHWVVVHKPETVSSDVALLLIEGGSNPSKPPAKPDDFLSSVATKTQSVTVQLRMVPNQPLSFYGESRRRTEDSIIAYTWQRYLETGDDRWLARLPMTKAAVRAMDAVQEFMASEAGGKAQVSRWVVTGGSKRGWATWTTAAADKRVIAIAPAVIDLLNMEPSFIHHWRVYGFWAPAISDYFEHGIMNWWGSEQMENLMKIVEPYQYRERLTMPKLIINSAGDQFFVPDSWQFYFKELKGEKYLRYVPNTDHGVTRRSDAAFTISAFYESIVKGWKRPEFEWEVTPEGKTIVVCKDKPAAVKVWSAKNPDARDFRLDKIGPAYKSEDVPLRADGRYEIAPAAPAKGFMAYFVELTFKTPGGSDLKVTTGTKVLPDVYPFPAPKLSPPAAARLLRETR